MSNFLWKKKSLKSEQSQPMFSICNRVKHLLFQMISLEQASLISIISMITCGFLSKIRLDHGFSNGGTRSHYQLYTKYHNYNKSCEQNTIRLLFELKSEVLVFFTEKRQLRTCSVTRRDFKDWSIYLMCLKS